jgi:hypothetical protein
MARILEVYTQEANAATEATKRLTTAQHALGVALLNNRNSATGLAASLGTTTSGGAGGGGGGLSANFQPFASQVIGLLNELVSSARGDAAYNSLQGHG